MSQQQTTLLSFFKPASPQATEEEVPGVKRPHGAGGATTPGPKRGKSVDAETSTDVKGLDATPPGAASGRAIENGMTPSSLASTAGRESQQQKETCSPVNCGENKHALEGGASSSSHGNNNAAGGNSDDDDDDRPLGELLGLTCDLANSSPSPSSWTDSAPRAFSPSRCNSQPSQGSAAVPSRLSQTFLDLGQASSLRLGRRCDECGMLFSDLQEDVQLHRRYCRRLAGSAEKLQGAVPLTQSAEAVHILEMLYAQRQGRRTTATPAGAPAAIAPCERLEGDPLRQVQAAHAGNSPCGSGADDSVTFVLRCGSPAVCESPAVVRLLESLGFVDAVLRAEEYTVVVLVDRTLQRVMAAVAGRASVREQDPQLVLGEREDGGTWCGHRRAFTHCDVNDIYLAPSQLFSKAAGTALRGATALAFSAHKDAVRQFFSASARPSVQQARLREQQQDAHQRALASLRRVLDVLGGAVVYGQRLQPDTGFSYSRTILAPASPASSGRVGSPTAAPRTQIPRAMLSRCVGGEHDTAAADPNDKENTRLWDLGTSDALHFHSDEDTNNQDSDDDTAAALGSFDGPEDGLERVPVFSHPNVEA